MALFRMHTIMIGLALVFCASFAVRAFATSDPVVGCISLLIGTGIGIYLRGFVRRLQVSSERLDS